MAPTGLNIYHVKCKSLPIYNQERENMPKVKVGDIVCINYMVGEPQYSGKVGIVEYIDDFGQIHGTWGGCALIDGDNFYVIPDEEMTNGFLLKNLL